MSEESKRVRELVHLGNHKVLHLKAELPKKEFIDNHDRKAVIVNHRRDSITLRLKSERFPEGCTAKEVALLLKELEKENEVKPEELEVAQELQGKLDQEEEQEQAEALDPGKKVLS